MQTGILLIWPLIAAALLFFLKGNQVKKAALAFSIIELLIALLITFTFQHTAHHQFLIDWNWIASMGINFKIGIDGISLLLILLTTVLVPLIILSSFNKDYDKPALFYGLILFMQMALIGVFVALDGFLFYVFWELALLPIYFICLLWGAEGRAKITFKFFIYTLFGSLLMLVGLIYLYLHTSGEHSFDINALYHASKQLDAGEQGMLFWLIFIAFAIKMPIFPFHTWQPDTYTVAPTQGTMLLSGIMLKMGTYGLIRWLLPIAPLGVQEWGGLAILLSIIGIVYASCIALIQKDFKRLIAYSSIAHVGLIAAGIMTFTLQGLQGGMIQMLSHGINVVGLFFIVDILYLRTKTREIQAMGGIRNVAPQFATLFLIILLGSIALPLTNGFIGEFLLLNGIYQYHSISAAFARLTVILGAVYMLRAYQSIMLGETKALTANFAQLSFTEKAVLVPIAIMIIVFGVYPQPLLELSEPAMQLLIDNYQVSIN